MQILTEAELRQLTSDEFDQYATEATLNLDLSTSDGRRQLADIMIEALRRQDIISMRELIGSLTVS